MTTSSTGPRQARRRWRVELPKTEARVSAILRQLLATYDDVVHRAAPGAATVVKRPAAGLAVEADRVDVRAYPSPTLTEAA